MVLLDKLPPAVAEPKGPWNTTNLSSCKSLRCAVQRELFLSDASVPASKLKLFCPKEKL